MRGAAAVRAWTVMGAGGSWSRDALCSSVPLLVGVVRVAWWVSWSAWGFGTLLAAEAGAVVVGVAGAVVAVVGGAAVVDVAWPSTTAPFWTVDDVAPWAVVVVAPEAVVVVEAGAVVVVTGAFSGGSGASTGRNRSSAVWPTMSTARARSFTPGRSTMMLLPCRLTSGSATPSESTRLR